eukprot:Pgem_evm1s15956
MTTSSMDELQSNDDYKVKITGYSIVPMSILHVLNSDVALYRVVSKLGLSFHPF